jgi:hypothetical protein
VLRYAFFPDFKGGPKLLMWGDQSGMAALSKFLCEWATTPREVEFGELGFYAAAGDRVIVLPYKGPHSALRETPGNHRIFHWELDKSQAEWFAELVNVLSASAHGHQYLEADRQTPEAIAVMVSIGEYPDDLIESKVRAI